MAVKKAGGSTKNGRQSQRKRLGIKVFGEQPVREGGIILTQRGRKFVPGNNTHMGRNFTINSKIAGIVSYSKSKDKTFVSVKPLSVEGKQ